MEGPVGRFPGSSWERPHGWKMDWLLWSGAFVLSLATLIKSADRFVDSAEVLGRMFGASPFIIGITLVAVGTSLPELATSIAAMVSGATEFIIGNAVGSNVTNILLILGVASLVHREFKSQRDMGGLDLPLILVSSAMIIIFAFSGRSISRLEGAALMAAYLVYLVYVLTGQRPVRTETRPPKRPGPFVWVAISTAGIYFGAGYTLRSTVELTRLIGFADTSVLAQSVVALGTSLPELIVSVAAARRNLLDMALGNIIGSNIFNALVVIGLPALLIPLAVSASVLEVGLPFLTLSTLVCYLTLIRRRIDRAMGSMFVLLYLVYLASLFGLA